MTSATPILLGMLPAKGEDSSAQELQPKECSRRYLRDFMLTASETMGEATAHCERAVSVSGQLAAGYDERI